MLVDIAASQFEELESYSNLSGQPIENLIEEALDEYIECVISSRSEALVEKSASA